MVMVSAVLLCPGRMVSELVQQHSADWDVYLPAQVFRLCLKEHSKTKEKPFSLLCAKEVEPVRTPRLLNVRVSFHFRLFFSQNLGTRHIS